MKVQDFIKSGFKLHWGDRVLHHGVYHVLDRKLSLPEHVKVPDCSVDHAMWREMVMLPVTFRGEVEVMRPDHGVKPVIELHDESSVVMVHQLDGCKWRPVIQRLH